MYNYRWNLSDLGDPLHSVFRFNNMKSFNMLFPVQVASHKSRELLRLMLLNLITDFA